MDHTLVLDAVNARAGRAHPHACVRCDGDGGNQILQLDRGFASDAIKLPRRIRIQSAPIKTDPRAALRIERETGRRTVWQTISGVEHSHITLLQPDESAALSAEPEIALAIFAQRAHITGESAIAQGDGQKFVIREAIQTLAARSDPQLTLPSLAQTPDAERRQILAAAKVIELPALGEIHQIRIAKRPEIARAIFIDAERFWIPSRTVRLKRNRKNLSVLELAHPAARRDPDRAGTRDVDVGDEVARQSILHGKCFHPVAFKKLQPGGRAEPQAPCAILGDAVDGITESVRAGAVASHAAVGVIEHAIALRADPQSPCRIFAERGDVDGFIRVAELG